jgi:D-alanyl-D-alanine-carboxypeptidase/D-alanyl-D-alanine-endopeptidase
MGLRTVINPDNWFRTILLVTVFLAAGGAKVVGQQTASPRVPPAQTWFPSDAEIKKLLADNIGETSQDAGIVVGILDGRGRRIVAYGNMARDDTRPLDGDTIFEVGSITKVFTSLLLMDMAQKGEVSVTDSIARYLPAGVKAPERNGRTITLQDLATHRSGLPNEPPNIINPFGGYTAQQLYDFLGSYRLPQDTGSEFEYSNLGVGLLGHLLSIRAGQDYPELLSARVLTPLGLRNTGIILSSEMRSRLAVGHDANLRPVPKMDFSLRAPLAPAGGLSSSANDLLTFLAANLAYLKTPLARAMAAQLSIRQSTSMPPVDIAYGWFRAKTGRSIIWHPGSTPGYRSYIGFNPDARIGVVVLSNRFWSSLPDDLGRHLLDPDYPLP